MITRVQNREVGESESEKKMKWQRQRLQWYTSKVDNVAVTQGVQEALEAEKGIEIYPLQEPPEGVQP